MISVREFLSLASQLAVVVCLATSAPVHTRSVLADADSNDASVSGTIPSPNQDFGDEYAPGGDLQRTSSIATSGGPTTRYQALSAPSFPMASAANDEPQASNEASVPVYVSPFNHAERGATTLASIAPVRSANFDHQESSHASPNYAPRPASAASPADLKTSASYGHHDHHGGHQHGYEHGGWLDMGAWTGGKGAFGWYADYPVGKKHHGY